MSFWAKIDFHVLYMSLMIAVLGAFLPWPRLAAIAVFIIPQGVVLTYMTDDLARQASGKKECDWGYLILNEIVVCSLSALCYTIAVAIP